jgi:hypothetical protein
MIRNTIRCAALLARVAAAACDEGLAVTNPNSPNAAQALSSPADLENFLGSYYKRWHSGMYGSQSNVEGMAAVMSFETYSTLSNNCIGQRVGIPRAANDNSIGNLCAPEQRRVYEYENEVQRVASSVLKQLNAPGYSLGSAAEDLRAKSFAEFLRGLSLGVLSLTYDSTAIIDETMEATDPGELKGYMEVNAAALDALQKAIDLADQSSKAAGEGGFPLPADWIPSSTSFTAAEFIKLVHSYKARYRAGVARDPAERAAVDWKAVIADAEAGITADHDNITSTTGGPGDSWRNTFDGPGNYQTQPPFIIGMGDVSGSYAAWTALPLANRGPDFHMVTPDQRFPQGTTRAEQQADFAISSCETASTKCKRYIANRPNGSDLGAQIPWGGSEYDFNRFHSWATKGDGTARNGKLVFFTKAENDLLEAEGQIRTGNFAKAAELINRTRVGNGHLPAITAFDGTSPVPGGDVNCVPKVPVALQGPLKCGNMMEAMKWEKRLETENTHFMAWYVDSRGWGDLPEGTPVHWATPFADLQVRGKPVYSVGGSSNPIGSAGKSTYGW